MMAGHNHVAVTTADLISHAGHVETVASAVTTAKQAGEATSPGPDAYGKLCVMVPVMLGALQGVLVAGIDQAAHSLHDTAERLRSTAVGYDSTDAEVSANMRRAGGLP
ncbi:type VII secretion target [Plantactinospora siamensis]|uniref:Type VII secretion target n=1 Tax=Plantactinospora siamensis TaxID=555372 RepID=A0ABV6NQE0_9ACTN